MDKPTLELTLTAAQASALVVAIERAAAHAEANQQETIKITMECEDVDVL